MATVYETSAPENEERNWNDHPHLTHGDGGIRECHCRLFHQLYDHTGLLWEDVLRIGKIWVQFRVNFDVDFDIYPNVSFSLSLFDIKVTALSKYLQHFI